MVFSHKEVSFISDLEMDLDHLYYYHYYYYFYYYSFLYLHGIFLTVLNNNIIPLACTVITPFFPVFCNSKISYQFLKNELWLHLNRCIFH